MRIISKKVISLQVNYSKEKFMYKVYILIFIFALCSIESIAQGGVSGSHVSAAVVEPITIPKSVDLNFESVAIIIAGSVEMIPLHVKNKSANGITLPVSSGTFTAASFFISSTTAYTYKISVPQSPLEVTNGNNTLVVRSFDSDPILNPDSDLLAGVFVSVSPVNVTVNYN